MLVIISLMYLLDQATTSQTSKNAKSLSDVRKEGLCVPLDHWRTPFEAQTKRAGSKISLHPTLTPGYRIFSRKSESSEEQVMYLKYCFFKHKDLSCLQRENDRDVLRRMRDA